MKPKMTRRELLRMMGIGSSALALAACQPKVVEKIVERTVVVTEEKIVKETVVVKEAVEVEKEVTRITEKVVEAKPERLPPAELRFGCYGTNNQYAEVMIANFQTMEPDVKVEIEMLAGDINQKLLTMGAAGTSPDVQWISDARVMVLGSNGVMLDMTPLAEADPTLDVSDIYPVMLGLGKWEGKWYMIPWAADAPVMYYNKTMLEEANYPLPEPLKGYTVEEFQQACAAVAKPDEQIYGWNYASDWWAIYVPWVEGWGGSFYNADKTKCMMDTPEAMAACQAIADFYCKIPGGAVPRGAQLGGDPFILGRACFYIMNRNFTKNVRDAKVEFEWDVALPPRQPVKHVAGSGTMGPGVSAAAAKRGNEWPAWKLASTLTKRATQQYFARQYLMIPVMQSLAKDPSWYELPPPPVNVDVHLEIPKIAIIPPAPNNPDCGTVYMGETYQYMTDAWQEMNIGCVPPEEALSKAVASINECIVRGGRI
jgi:ABC-type glycerol-3-phosphate transport system substrate-binding protein